MDKNSNQWVPTTDSTVIDIWKGIFTNESYDSILTDPDDENEILKGKKYFFLAIDENCSVKNEKVMEEKDCKDEKNSKESPSKKKEIEIKYDLNEEKTKLLQANKEEKSKIEESEKIIKNEEKQNKAKGIFSITVPDLIEKEIFSDKKKMTLKKRGRKTDKENSKKFHDKMSPDNILRKIQNLYITFLIDFVNQLIKSEPEIKELSFFKFDYGFKKTVTKVFEDELKQFKLSELFILKPNNKYKKFPSTYNKDIFNKISQKSPELKHFLESHLYLDLFDNIFYQKEKQVDLNQLGLNKVIKLSGKITLYQDFLDKIKKNNEENYEAYAKKLKECIDKHFLKKPWFKCRKH